ncbi:DMT family transporter [Bacillus aquiflavi]|uniref:DMT family transporter n=1 Tax=Bacillus aquiflavi TaxID=2672567 RepID=UPI001CA95DC1|nr:DMT family transporter [Bacillus aquiflavi]UAC49656.1 DMT family transporter [Bacillus aquiflavi]
MIEFVRLAFIIMWSSGAIFVELGLRDADPFTFLFLRLLFAAIILWTAVFFLKTALPTNIKEWRYILLTGLCVQTGYQIFYYLAIYHEVSPGVLTIILGAQPIITTIALKEKSNTVQWFGLLFGMVGLILVVADNIIIASVTLIGILNAILSLLCITVGTILQKKIKIIQPANMAIQYSSGALVLFLLLLFFEQSLEWTMMFSVSLAWMTIVISVGATFLLYYLIEKDHLMKVTSLFYAVPPVTAMLDFLIFGNMIKLFTIIGMILIVIGLILINRQTVI